MLSDPVYGFPVIAEDELTLAACVLQGYAVKGNHNFKWVGLIALAGVAGLLLAL